MSGLGILGVAASAMQVAQVSLAIVTSLTSLFNQLRDAPKVVQSQLLQVQTLFEISLNTPQLQTSEVESILQSCARDGEALREILTGLVIERNGSKIRRWINAVGGLMEEKKVVELLQSLEVGKTSLSLCIAQIDS